MNDNYIQDIKTIINKTNQFMQCFDAVPVSGGAVAGGMVGVGGGMVGVGNTGEVGQAGSGHICGLSTPQCFHRRSL